jgi:hypothetical protein
LLCCCLVAKTACAQTPHALVPGLQVDSLFKTHANPNRLAQDPLSGNLWYCVFGGDVYEITLTNGQAVSETLRFSQADHGIAQPQGMCFVDSALYLSGHTLTGAGYVTARISKAKLQPNGSRAWTTVVETAVHPYSNHPFTSVVADPAGDFLYWASGARTMAGEVFTDNGIHPGRREAPYNSRLYRFPIQTENLVLPNDSATLDASGYVYCWGLRNAYSMDFNAAGDLLSIDNSGERDDPEELNWLRQGRHYGFPWKMGDHWNPLMDPNYDVNQDPLVNHLCGGYTAGIFAATPDFPAQPNTVFVDPIRNLGPDADFYRDSLTGQVRDASVDGHVMRSFTAHRSPLGLKIDRDSLLGGAFRGRGFLLSFMPGGDSSGMSPVSPWGSPGPFVDSAQDLLQLDLSFDTGSGDYMMQTHRIIDGFFLPVDAVLDGDKLYVLEQRGGSRQNLWRVSFPLASASPEPVAAAGYHLQVAPNPVDAMAAVYLVADRADVLEVVLYDMEGRIASTIEPWKLQAGKNVLHFPTDALSAGVYLLHVQGKQSTGWAKVLKR